MSKPVARRCCWWCGGVWLGPVVSDSGTRAAGGWSAVCSVCRCLCAAAGSRRGGDEEDRRRRSKGQEGRAAERGRGQLRLLLLAGLLREAQERLGILTALAAFRRPAEDSRRRGTRRSNKIIGIAYAEFISTFVARDRLSCVPPAHSNVGDCASVSLPASGRVALRFVGLACCLRASPSSGVGPRPRSYTVLTRPHCAVSLAHREFGQRSQPSPVMLSRRALVLCAVMALRSDDMRTSGEGRPRDHTC